MKISKAAATTARRLFGLCQEAGRLDENRLRGLINQLIARKPRDYTAILAALQRLVRLDMNRRKVVIESAVILDDATRARVVAGLSKQYGEGLHVTSVVTPELVGGLRIRVGDDVLDGSVQGRLRRLSNAF
jgi:F-type H+-transporting ATPase subunit delta